jgi:hypothetical protein
MTETPATKSYVAHWLYLFVTYAALGEQDFGNQIGELKAKTDHRPALEQMFERCLDHINEDERNQLCEIVAKLVHAVVNGCSGAPWSVSIALLRDQPLLPMIGCADETQKFAALADQGDRPLVFALLGRHEPKLAGRSSTSPFAFGQQQTSGNCDSVESDPLRKLHIW